MIDLQQVCEHEIGHGIISLLLQFDGFTKVFVDVATPGITRRGGVDIQVEGLRELFDTSIPQADRRAMAVKVIAVYAAGREAEFLLGRNPDDNRNAWDEDQIQWFGMAAMWADEDMELLRNSVQRDNEWGKWAEVDNVIAEGRKLAHDLLRENLKAMRQASIFLHDSVKSMRGKGHITRAQLSRIMGGP